MPDLSAPWRGVHVATALPFRDDDELSVDYEGYAAHVRFLAEHGCDGVCPNGSLGEYQTLTDEERARVVRVAVEAAPEGFGVMPGVAAYGALESRRWAEQAREAGARAVLALPPNSYRADREAVVGHYREVARAGLPVVAYNNPHDTKIDLTPELLAELHGEGLIAAVKEFSGDVRRAYEIAERAPGLDLLIGADDVLLELGLSGAVGWIAGYPNAIPDASVELYRLATSGAGADLEKALPLYRALHPLLRWDSRTEFVQAIKASMDLAGLRGGSCRPPRSRLAGEVAARVVRETETVLALGYR
ncbi:dihydrodipicolinate synthase family protein [Streptomyces iranensis]|uniref:4-hydroxy-tetrahydrodipicolinate synthase n=1 Tax=Streptomyces iranensis TaxID=576784 RepID=A0A060ZQ20_9ACTN|nr:dihydrodipicolinate synthase family protein [Streptomyces iranensis]MBP2065890.1 4-hydroxy-tetrahydrodipicolinate synthase [Streptomyces iranensis]CDR08277.1 dihydrodipicolinate synthetase [Streptomyces iranensis]